MLREFLRLKRIMERLRDREHGCPWDVAQTFETIAPYTIEEAFEVAEAIARGDRRDLCEELGDLQLQIVFHARIAEEEESFDLADSLHAINDKMIRRHPHVFAGAARPADAAAQTRHWQELKARERQQGEKGSKTMPESVLDDVPRALPALMRARKLQERAARLGFDWPDIAPVIAKVREELDELEAEMRAVEAADGGQSSADRRIADELGDLLFAVVNLARHLNVDPEMALAKANLKFIRRFKKVEKQIHESNELMAGAGPSLEQLDRWWEEAKEEERRD
ncbi:MAG: nucleoside triphosphate pyrophosphohydrolase [Alphaproteobacteria bacterium]|nr:MAG: nucleoside triphosphate pyrophosphohydrolase [Alphaproteobacteria bacterium]